ncbi:MAG: DUF6635 family protein [Pseudomonadota bacterium]
MDDKRPGNDQRSDLDVGDQQEDGLKEDLLAATEQIDAFVGEHFGWRGTLKLHSAAFGWDLLRAPFNVILAPVFLLVRVIACAMQMVGLRSLGNWLSKRRLLLPTAVARRVETLVITDLLAETSLTSDSRSLIADYAGVRSAVSEITTSLIVLATGIALFGTATPCIASLAPEVSDYVVQSIAVADFWLGSGLGARWYALFPVTMPLWSVVTIFLALALIASLVTTFAGILADPIQARLGLHHRRLRKLLTSIARAQNGTSGITAEHIVARMADLTDASLSLLRAFRP